MSTIMHTDGIKGIGTSEKITTFRINIRSLSEAITTTTIRVVGRMLVTSLG